jgi:dihydroxy-acid dehydratase
LIGLIENGDPIVIDIPQRLIRLDLDEATLSARGTAMQAKGAAAWKPKDRKRNVSPALRAYAALATNASRGAVRDVGQVESR